jgi:hypothetical protein
MPHNLVTPNLTADISCAPLHIVKNLIWYDHFLIRVPVLMFSGWYASRILNKLPAVPTPTHCSSCYLGPQVTHSTVCKYYHHAHHTLHLIYILRCLARDRLPDEESLRSVGEVTPVTPGFTRLN